MYSRRKRKCPQCGSSPGGCTAGKLQLPSGRERTVVICDGCGNVYAP